MSRRACITINEVCQECVRKSSKGGGGVGGGMGVWSPNIDDILCANELCS